MEYYLYLRPVSEQDLELIHSWNLNPIILKTFNLSDNKPNSWKDTLTWWRTLGSSLVFIVMVVDKIQSATYWKGRPIGVSWVRNLKSDMPEIGGYIADTDYYKKAVVELYNLTLETVNRLKGIQKASCKLRREEQVTIGELGKCGWNIDSEVNGVVNLIYERVTVQSTQ